MTEENNKPKALTFQDDDEAGKFAEFKKLVSDLQQEDQVLVRFFRARDRDLVKAKDMLVANLKWRKDNNIESFANWTPPKCFKEKFRFHYRITGKDFDGRLVLWFPLGGAKGREMFQAGHREEIFHFVYHMLENAMNLTYENGKDQVVFLLGMENVTMRQMMNLESLQVIYQGFQTLEKNYPEGLKHAFILNAPWMFHIAYNFVKPVLAANTIAKLQIYDSNKSKWIPKLLEIMPMKSIPEEYLDN